jgi:hypothetical protein
MLISAIKYWRSDGFIPKKHFRLQISQSRRDLIGDICVLLTAIDELKAPSLSDVVPLQLAICLENSGNFVRALTILSDLISREASNGVDLSYVIFRAACIYCFFYFDFFYFLIELCILVILLHLGREAQACDYLDFIHEDAPSQDGYGRAHVYSLLSIIYENRGPKFQHMLDAVASNFQYVREDEMPFLEEYSEKMSTKSKKHFVQFHGAKIWEALSLQALSRCDYVFAIEMLKQVIFLVLTFIL